MTLHDLINPQDIAPFLSGIVAVFFFYVIVMTILLVGLLIFMFPTLREVWKETRK